MNGLAKSVQVCSGRGGRRKPASNENKNNLHLRTHRKQKQFTFENSSQQRGRGFSVGGVGGIGGVGGVGGERRDPGIWTAAQSPRYDKIYGSSHHSQNPQAIPVSTILRPPNLT